MLYDGEPITATASALGVHRTTIWRWRRLRSFRKEWNRLDRNMRRRIERHDVKRMVALQELWDEKAKMAEGNLYKRGKKLKGNAEKMMDSAWNEYENIIGNGFSLAKLLDVVLNDKPIKRKRRRNR